MIVRNGTAAHVAMRAGSTLPALEWWRPEPPAGGSPGRNADRTEASASGGSFAFGALVVFTIVMLLSPQSFWPALGPLRLAMLSGATAATAWLIEALVHRRPLIGPSTELRVVLALVAWAVVTVPLSWWPAGSLAYLVDPWGKALVLFWLLASVVVTRERARRISWCLVLVAVPLALTAIRNLLAGAYLEHGTTAGFGRIQGYEAALTGNPNDLALTLNLILPLGIGLFLASRRPLVRAATLALVALDVAAVVATFSRGGFLTMLVILLAFAVREAGARAVWLLPFLLLVFVPLLPSGYLDQMGTVARIEEDPTGSAQERLSDMVAAGRSVLSHPLVGAGVGMNILAMNAERGAAWRNVHNVYLQYALELGLPGLVLFTALLVGCVRRAGAARRAAASRGIAARDLFHLAGALQISLIAFAVAALFHPVAYNVYFYYLAGLALGVARAVETGPPEGESHAG